MAKKDKLPKVADEVDEVHAETATPGFFARLLDQFTTAWLFLTRVPLPRWWNKPDAEAAEAGEGADAHGEESGEGSGEEDDKAADKSIGMTPLADTVRAWPVVGLFIGALAGLVLWGGASLGLHPLAASFAALIVAAVATGALHEDGLADVVDGFGGGDSKAKKLRIMRDSRIGAFGVMALILLVGFKGGSLGGFNNAGLAAVALVAAHTLSRAMMPMLMVALPPARRSGLGKGAGQPSREDAAMAAAIGVLIAILALGWGPGLVASALAALGAFGVGWLAQRHIGGFTGDVLGAAQQVSEALVLAGLAVALRTVFYA